MSRAPSQVIAAGFAGGAIGALGGAAIGDSFGSYSGVGALSGAFLLGVISALADANRVPGRPQPLYVRVSAAAFIGAAVGGLLELVLPDWPVVLPAALIGLVTGLIGFRPFKILLGTAVGVLLGLGFDAWAPDIGWGFVTALTVVVYRSLAAFLWRGKDQVRIMGERLPEDRLPFVVPFAEATRYVGVDYLERYAKQVGAEFARNPGDVGIVASLDLLVGPTFEPTRVDPVIREFYEHTSRFTLSIIPEWRRWMRLPYRIYRRTVARPLGQANAPFEIDEVQRGVVSWIDTIDIDHDGVADFRAWVRAYDTGEPLYLGIYTVQHIDDLAYVAVGFPLPNGNFTATLAPSNHRDDAFLLSSDSEFPHSGHYLSVIEDDGRLTTLQLASFGEEIEVFVEDGELKTEHRFSLGGVVFLTLHYTIERK